MANILDEQDPRQNILRSDRNVNLGTPQRLEPEALELSPPIAPDAPRTTMPAAEAPSIQVEGEEAGFQLATEAEAPTPLTPLAPQDTSSVLQQTAELVEPAPPVTTTEAATQPSIGPVFEPGVNVYDQVNQGFADANRANQDAISNSITESYNQRPALERVYVNPFVNLEQIVGNVRTEMEHHNSQVRAQNAANEQLNPKPQLSQNAQDVLRQLPTLNSTNPILNQIPGGLIGQMGEAPGFDQRWFSGDVVGGYFDVLRTIGSSIAAGAALDVLPSIGRGLVGMVSGAGNVAGLIGQGRLGRAFMQNIENFQRAATEGQSPELRAALAENNRALGNLGNQLLQGFAPQETADSRPGDEQYRIDPLRGYFGEMGAGLPGLALYTASAAGGVLGASIYTATDAVGALAGRQPQGRPGFNPLFRYGQLAQGVDLGFFNNQGINNQRYLATILPTDGGKFQQDNPRAYAAAFGISAAVGLGLDIFTGGIADNAALALTRAARRRAGYIATRGIAGANILPNSTASQALARLQAQQNARRAGNARRGIPDFDPTNAPQVPGRNTPTAPATQEPVTIIQRSNQTELQGVQPLPPVSWPGSTEYPTVIQPPPIEYPPLLTAEELIARNGRTGAERLAQVPDMSEIERTAMLSRSSFRERSVSNAQDGFVQADSPGGQSMVVPTDTRELRDSTFATEPLDSTFATEPRDSTFATEPVDATRLETWVVGRARELTGRGGELARQRQRVEVVDLGTTPNELPGSPPDQRLLTEAIEPEEVLEDGRTLENILDGYDAPPNRQLQAASDEITDSSPTAERIVGTTSADRSPTFEAPSGYSVTDEKTNAVVDRMLDSGRPISERTMRILPGVDTSGTEVTVRGRTFVRDGDNWVKKSAEAPSTSSVLQTPGLDDVPGMPATTAVARLADDIVEDVTPNGSVAASVASQPGVREALVREGQDSYVYTPGNAGTMTDTEQLAERVLNRITGLRSRLDNLSARIKAEPNSTIRAQLQQQRIKTRAAIQDAQDTLDKTKVPTRQASAAFKRATPVVTQAELRPTTTARGLRGYMDSPQYTREVGALDGADVAPVRRSNKELSRLAKFMTDPNGKPLMNPNRKSPLNRKELDRLNESYPGVFSQFGKPVPLDLNHPQLRVEVAPATVEAPQVTQFVAPKAPVRATEADVLVDDTVRRTPSTNPERQIEELRREELFEQQNQVDIKTAADIEAARLDIIERMRETGEAADGDIEALLELNRAYQELPNDVSNPRVVQEYIETLAPKDMQVSPNNAPLVSRYLQIDEEYEATGAALRELNEGITELQDDVLATSSVLQQIPNYRRGNASDEIANAAMFSESGDFDLPPYQLRALEATSFGELTPVDPSDVVDVSRWIPYDTSREAAIKKSVSGVGNWFHGSQVQPDAFYSQQFSPSLGSSSNELGAGLYLTDRGDLAKSYAQAERNITSPSPGAARLGTPTVYEFNRVEVRNTLYASQKVTPEVQGVFDQAVQDVFSIDPAFTRALREQQGRNNMISDQWLNVREAYEQTYNSPISELQYQEFQRVVSDKLYRELGYDSVLQVDKFRGRTLVILDPTEVPGAFWNKAPLSKPLANSVDRMNYMQNDFEIPTLDPTVSRQEQIGRNLGLGDVDQTRLTVGANVEPLTARLNRHHNDALLHAAHQRKSTLAWEQQSRQGLSGQLLDDYLTEYENLLDDGIAISRDRFEAMEQVKQAALEEAQQRSRSAIETAPAQAVRETKKFQDISRDTPCL